MGYGAVILLLFIKVTGLNQNLIRKSWVWILFWALDNDESEM